MLLRKESNALPADTERRLVGYLDDVVRVCRATAAPVVASRTDRTIDSRAIAADIFGLLTNKKFCYLSKGRVQKYRDEIIESFVRDIVSQEPVAIYYDIGGGYHAGIEARERELVFSVGLAELMILSQCAAFNDKLRRIYAPGVRFHLVIDNLCAFFVNDIPIESTEAYCGSLNELIRQLSMQNVIDLVVESQEFSLSDYEFSEKKAIGSAFAGQPTRAEVENVARFLGRSCDRREASERIARYRLVTEVSESHLCKRVDGVRMTQRATESTLPFRSFPGGDSRVQAGEVVLTENENGTVRPLLVTSTNVANYALIPVPIPSFIPEQVPQIRFAQPI